MLDQQAALDQQEAASKQSETKESAGNNGDNDDPLEELVLSAVEQELLDYHLIVGQQLVTPVPESPMKGISLSQLQGLLEEG